MLRTCQHHPTLMPSLQLPLSAKNKINRNSLASSITFERFIQSIIKAKQRGLKPNRLFQIIKLFHSASFFCSIKYFCLRVREGEKHKVYLKFILSHDTDWHASSCQKSKSVFHCIHSDHWKTLVLYPVTGQRSKLQDWWTCPNDHKIIDYARSSWRWKKAIFANIHNIK